MGSFGGLGAEPPNAGGLISGIRHPRAAGPDGGCIIGTVNTK